MDLIPLHNEGPEHFCGLCRLDPHHREHDDNPHTVRETRERLVVRCRIKNIITESAADELLREIE